MISVKTYRDKGLIHPDVIVRASSQHELASRNATGPDTTQRLIDSIEKYGREKALPEQIFAPFHHDANTLSWVIKQLNQLPAPNDKNERIFCERWLYWTNFCSSELAANYASEIATSKLAKATSDYSEQVGDFQFNAMLAGKELPQILSILNQWIAEMHELELEPDFEKTKIEAMARQIATLGGAGSDQLNQWLELRPSFDEFEPELEAFLVEVALDLLRYDTTTPVKLDSLLYWVESEELSHVAHYALRNRIDQSLAEQLVDNFPNYPKNIRSELGSILCFNRSEELREKIWNLYQQENDFEVLGKLTSLLVAYGGESFEAAAIEMLNLDGVEFVDDLIFRIYSNRVLSNQSFPEQATWKKRLSEYFDPDHIQAELNYEIDPSLEEELGEGDFFDD